MCVMCRVLVVVVGRCCWLVVVVQETCLKQIATGRLVATADSFYAITCPGELPSPPSSSLSFSLVRAALPPLTNNGLLATAVRRQWAVVGVRS